MTFGRLQFVYLPNSTACSRLLAVIEPMNSSGRLARITITPIVTATQADTQKVMRSMSKARRRLKKQPKSATYPRIAFVLMLFGKLLGNFTAFLMMASIYIRCLWASFSFFLCPYLSISLPLSVVSLNLSKLPFSTFLALTNNKTLMIA